MTDEPSIRRTAGTEGARSPALGTNQGIVQTGDRSSAIIQASRRPLPLPTSVQSPGGLVRLPRRPSPIFVGRDQALAMLRTALFDASGCGLINQAVYGLGGVGKSELALQYADRHRADYRLVWWIEADTASQVKMELAALARALVTPYDSVAAAEASNEEAVSWVCAWLNANTEWLLIFDNVEHFGDIATYLAQFTHGHVVITTRRDIGWERLRVTPVRLSLLVRQASIDLLADLTGSNATADRVELAELAEHLGDLPLALTQAGTYIALTPQVTVARYLKLLKSSPIRAYAATPAGWADEPAVAKVWELTHARIQAIDALAGNLLKLLAAFASESLPCSVLSGPADVDELTVADALALLASYSMITLVSMPRSDGGREDGVSMHRLVQTVILHRLTEEEAGDLRRTAADLILAALPDEPDEPSTWPVYRNLLPHARTVLPLDSPGLTRVLDYLEATGDITTGLQIQRQVHAHFLRNLGPEHLDTVVSQADLAYWTGLAGDAVTARDKSAALLPVMESHLGAGHPRVLSVRYSLARWTGMAGNPVAARDQYAALLPLMERRLGAETRATLSTNASLAEWTGLAGDAVAARRRYAALSPIMERVRGKEAPSTLDVRARLAHWTGVAGDQEEAREQLAVLTSLRARVLGAEHPDTQATRLELAAWTAAARKVEAPRLRRLPADVPDFTGRQHSLDLLTSWLERPRRTNTMVVQGLPGVGKTTLVTHWAHLHADRFPDGQIVIDLRGQSPGQPPMTSAESLGEILRSLGVSEPAADEAELMLLYRSRIAGRRLLLILDNAADPALVRTLLPDSEDCVVLVTSRTRMAPLRATGHADLMDLSPFDPGNAVALLLAVLGDDSSRTGDREGLAELARACGYHPLALRISAAKLAEDSALSVHTMVRELRRPDRILEGDPEEGFRSALDLAYESLSAAQRRTFRHVGLLPGRDFTPEVLAAALGVSAREAVVALEGLHRAYLVEPLPGPRYRVHDLVKRQARELGRHAEGGVREATVRLLDHYLAVATNPATPRRWFEAERQSLVSAVRMAGDSGAHGMAWRLAEAVFEPFSRLRYYENNLEVQQSGLASAMQVNNRRAIALMRRNLGSIHLDIGPPTLAVRYLSEAVADFTLLEEHIALAGALNGLAEAHDAAGRNEAALTCASGALESYQKAAQAAGVADCLHTLSRLHLSQERYEPGLQYARQACDARKELGDRHGTAQSLIILATVQRKLGELNAALSEGLEALSICHELGDEHAEAETLLCLAEIYDLLRLPHDAQRDAERALAGYTATGDQYGCGRALRTLGRIARNCSRYGEALAHYEQALSVQVELHHEQGQAETLGDIGLVHWQLSDYPRANEYLGQALFISRVIGDEPVEARMLNRLARVRLRQGMPQVAFVYALEALDLAQGLGNRRAEADVQETLSCTYLSLGEHQRALGAAKASLAIREELRDNRASALLSVAQALHTAGRAEEALEPAMETVELQKETGTRDRWAAALTTLAMVLLDLDLDLGRVEEALAYARQARDVHQECGTRWDLGCALRALGLISAKLDDRGTAVAHLQEAARIFEEVRDLSGARQAFSELRSLTT
ncbi:tetratricopeptide repeat protein [Nonomuraea rubra]